MFRHPEYDTAFAGFVNDTVHELARTREPLLSGIQFVPMSGSVGSEIATSDGEAVDIAPSPTMLEFSLSGDQIRDTDIEAVVVQLDAAAEEYARQLVGLLLQTASQITRATGNVVDAGGGPLSFEHIYQALASMDFELDENDELVLPSLVMHPETAAKLPQPTGEQERLMSELKAQKRGEALARRRRRRLS